MMELEEENKKPSYLERKTVRFNVGGTIYEVSRILINRFPDTMLARLCSETWSPESNLSEEEPLFIERDGDRFRYCLDYMRDGGLVDLPATVSKAALLRDLEYYGFQEVDPSAISQAPSTTDEQFRKCWTNNYWQLQRDARKLEKDAEEDNNVAKLANECAKIVSDRTEGLSRETFCKFLKEEEGVLVVFCLRPYSTCRKHGNYRVYTYFNTATSLHHKSKLYVSRFQNHLKRHGLIFVKCEDARGAYNIYLKKL